MDAVFEYITYNFDILLNILGATGTVILLFAVTILCSIPCGFLFTLMKQSRSRVLSTVAGVYITVIRGTPLLLQLFFFMFGLPLIPVIGSYLKMPRLVAAMVGFVFNYSAYFAEIFRGGLLAVDKGQYEAAKVLGFTHWQTMLKIVIPQMFRVALPSLTNEFITLVKDTALIYAVAVPDILKVAKDAMNRDFRISPLIMAGIVYLILNFIVEKAMGRLEKRYQFE